MENENANTNEPNDAMPPEETPAAPVKRQRKPRVKDRTFEELDTIAPAKMTDSEKNQYIMACRATIGHLEAQNTALDKNCQSAYNQYQTAADNNAKLIAKFNEDMAFICSASRNLNKSIHMIGGNL